MLNPKPNQTEGLLELLGRPGVRLARQETGQIGPRLQHRKHDSENVDFQHRKSRIEPELDVSGSGATTENGLGFSVSGSVREILRRSIL